jgi:hypothetical protein
LGSTRDHAWHYLCVGGNPELSVHLKIGDGDVCQNSRAASALLGDVKLCLAGIATPRDATQRSSDRSHLRS